MKKSVLLTSAFALAASFVSAQVAGNVQSRVDLKKLTAKSPVMVSEGATPLKNFANNLYYSRPAGSVFLGIDANFRAYSNTLISVAPYTDIVYKNQSLTPSSTIWSVNDKVYDADENGDLHYGMMSPYSQEMANRYYANPTLSSTDGKTTFTYGEWNENGAGIRVDTISNKAFADINAGMYAFANGTYPSGFLYANEEISTTGYTSNSFITFYDAPMSPLYVEYITLPYVWYKKDPLPANAKITMTFVETKEVEGETLPQLTDNVLGTMTGTADDMTFVDQSSSQYTPNGEMYIYTLQLANRGTDAFGNPTMEPIILDKPFAVLLSVPEGQGIHAAFYGAEIPDDEVVSTPNPTFMIGSKEGEDDRMYRYNQTQLMYSFFGGFDYVNPMTTGSYEDGTKVSDLNQLQVSADGKTVSNVGGGSSMDYAIMNCAFDWVDGDSEVDNYTTDLPEWITGIQYNQYSAGTTFITVECEALPAGVKGRGVKLYFTGHGVTSTDPLYVLQGEYTKSDVDAAGISSVVVNKKDNSNRIYNLAGQQVSKDYKGLVIKNGAKMLVK